MTRMIQTTRFIEPGSLVGNDTELDIVDFSWVNYEQCKSLQSSLPILLILPLILFCNLPAVFSSLVPRFINSHWPFLRFFFSSDKSTPRNGTTPARLHHLDTRKMLVQGVIRSWNEARSAGNPELLLFAFNPPGELDIWIRDNLRRFGCADIGGCQNEWELVISWWLKERTKDMGSHMWFWGAGVDCRKLEYFVFEIASDMAAFHRGAAEDAMLWSERMR
ncbi:pyridoxamine 5-phosphate oxidase-fmn-binding [Moniliophthora roreri]|nr:pyridoxamine 5-phosphate oxidase-fmn-binding [Moniliophthora roreri]